MKINESERAAQNRCVSRCHSEPPNQPDFAVIGSGTVYLFQPLTEKAAAWLKEHFPPSSDHQYLGDSLAIGHRYISDIIVLAIFDGRLMPPAELSPEGRVN
jgi:hypothetical protein